MANELAPKLNPQVASEGVIAPVVEPSGVSALTSVATGLFNAAGAYAKGTDGTSAERKALADTKARADISKTFTKARDQIDDPAQQRSYLRRSVGAYLDAGTDPDLIGEIAKANGFEDLADIVVPPEQQAINNMLTDETFLWQSQYFMDAGLTADQAQAKAAQFYDVRAHGGEITRESYDSYMSSTMAQTHMALNFVDRNANIAWSQEMVVQIQNDLTQYEAEARRRAQGLGLKFEETATYHNIQAYKEMLGRSDATTRMKSLYGAGSLGEVITALNVNKQMTDETSNLLIGILSNSSNAELFRGDLEQSLNNLLILAKDNGKVFDPGLANLLKERASAFRNLTIINSQDEFNQVAGQAVKAGGVSTVNVPEGVRPQDHSRAGVDDDTLKMDLALSRRMQAASGKHKRGVPRLSDEEAADTVDNLFMFTASAKEMNNRKGGFIELDDKTVDFWMYKQNGDGPTNMQTLLEKSFAAGTPEYVYDFDGLKGLVEGNVSVVASELQSRYGENSPKFTKPQVFTVGQDDEGNTVYNFNRDRLEKEIADTEKLVEQVISRSGNPGAAQDERRKVAALQEVLKAVDSQMGSSLSSTDPADVTAVYEKIQQYRGLFPSTGSSVASLLEVPGSAEGGGFKGLSDRLFKLQVFNGEIGRMASRFSFVQDANGSVLTVEDMQSQLGGTKAKQQEVGVENADQFREGQGVISKTREVLGSDTPEARAGRQFDALPEEQKELEAMKAIVRKDEGFKGEAYIPVPGDVPTIGYGFTEGVKDGDKMTKEEAETRLDHEVSNRLAEIKKAVPNWDEFPRDIQMSLFTSWYRGSLVGSPKTLRLIKQGEYEKAAEEFLDNQEYKTADEKGRPGIKSRMEHTSRGLKLMQMLSDYRDEVL